MVSIRGCMRVSGKQAWGCLRAPGEQAMEFRTKRVLIRLIEPTTYA